MGIQWPFYLSHIHLGVFANLYARTYPDGVLGVVFVDATHPNEIAAQRGLKAPAILSAINSGVKNME